MCIIICTYSLSNFHLTNIHSCFFQDNLKSTPIESTYLCLCHISYLCIYELMLSPTYLSFSSVGQTEEWKDLQVLLTVEKCLSYYFSNFCVYGILLYMYSIIAQSRQNLVGRHSCSASILGTSSDPSIGRLAIIAWK
jgi:hypothetical protein